jgi:Spy/CpxP family protein refolding chaperone
VGDTTVESSPVTDLLQHHRHHHHGGVLMLITISLDTLGLSPEEQARIEEIRSDLVAKMGPARSDELQLVELLANGLEESSLDPTKVNGAIAQMATSSEAVHASAIGDLNQLHAVLTPPQRGTLVDKLEGHWQLWKRANTGERRPTVAIGQEIGLTPDQIGRVQNQLDAQTPPPSEHENEIQDYLRDFSHAFRADTFDAGTLKAASGANRHLAEWGATRLARFCEVVNPMLTGEQRQKLVALLREHLDHDEGQAKE